LATPHGLTNLAVDDEPLTI